MIPISKILLLVAFVVILFGLIEKKYKNSLQKVALYLLLFIILVGMFLK
jgi:hypothetical protein